jgi:hypothetical protein
VSGHYTEGEAAAAARAELPGNVHAGDLAHFHPTTSGDVSTDASVIVTAMLAVAFEVRTLAMAELYGTGILDGQLAEHLNERLGR